MSVVVDLGDGRAEDSGAVWRKHVDRSVADIELSDSLDEDGLGFGESLRQITRDRSARAPLLLTALLVAFALVQLWCSKRANSLALVASAFFDLVDAVVLLVGIWGHVVTKNKANFAHSYGFERFEVVARFATSSYFLFVCLWVFFEGIEHLLEVEPTVVDGSYLTQVGLIGIVLQGVHTLVFRKYALTARASLTSTSPAVALAWEFFADVLLVLTGLVISRRGLMAMDTLVAVVLTALIAYQMAPVMRSTALILLQSTPPSVPTGKLLREVSTIDGVLEVRKEHFWSTGANVHVGTLRVRARAEVDEQVVLDKITSLCAPYLQHLTVQIEKDSWETRM